jgi:GTP-binding protein
MKFLDEAKIYVKAGDGGDGCVSFRRVKFIEFGGPDGGAGGRGGSVFVQAVKNIDTLIGYRYRQHFKVPKGKDGSWQNKTGKSSEDLILDVPVGTQILGDDKATEIADLIREGSIVKVAEGGRGGAGNCAFKTSVCRAPKKAIPGLHGEERWLWLRLKTLADVGLIGMPNAGKSTFISRVTNAKAKIASYPFSTTTPLVGVRKYDDRDVVIADIPGLLEGAHLGRGLGGKVLSHVERCSVLLHFIDISSANPAEDYRKIRREMLLYDASLAKKPEIVVLNKMDLLSAEEMTLVKRNIEQELNREVLVMSSLIGEKCEQVLDNAASYVY